MKFCVWVWVNNIAIQLLWLIRTLYNIDLFNISCNEYEYNVHIKFIPFEICLIHKATHLDSFFHKKKKILINRINDLSNLNHSSKFTVLAVVVFTRKKKTKTLSNTSTEYCSVCTQIILVFCFVYMLSYAESKSTTWCILLSMSTMSTSILACDLYKCDIKVSMNAYKYQKL